METLPLSEVAPLRSEPVVVGGTLGERYLIQKLLGKGGMGEVYQAMDRVLGKSVALKLVVGAAAELRDEVLLAHQVTHRNVCRTYDLEPLDGRWLLKMELVDGINLEQHVLRRRGRLRVDEVVAIARQIVDGLAAAHAQGVVHCDLKPQNVMIENGTERVLIMDFGIARGAGVGAEEIVGTPTFMAPEQSRGENVDARADLYALGGVIYFLLTKRLPFPAKTSAEAIERHRNDPPPDVRATRKDAPPWLAELILRLLAKDPARRPSGDELGALLAGAQLPRPKRWWIVPAIVVVTGMTVGVLLRARRLPEWRPKIVDLPIFDENAGDLDISADGKWITYTSDRDERDSFRIFVEPLDGGQARAISPPGSVGHSRFLADGTVAYALKNFTPGMVRVSPEGGTPEPLDPEAIVATPCGADLLLIRAFPWRLVLRAQDGSERELRRFPLNTVVTDARCDRTGSWIAYAWSALSRAGSQMPSDLTLLRRDGSERQITRDGADNSLGSFTPDGRRLIFSSARSGKQHLWELSLEGGEPAELTNGEGPDVSPVVSPDGRIFFAIDVTTIQVFAFPTDDRERPGRKLTSRGDFVTLEMMPGGRELLATANRAHKTVVLAIDVQTGAERELAVGQRAAVAAGGQEVVFVEDDEVRAVPFAGGSARTIARAAGRVLKIFAGPDGTLHLAVAELDAVHAWSVPLAGGEPVREAQSPWIAIAPAPVGGWRVALTTNQLHVLPPGRAPGDPVTILSWDYFAWELDGRSFLYIHDEKLHRYEVESGTDTVLREPQAQAVTSSPDGKILYATTVVAHVRRAVIQNYDKKTR
jgi:hypothetical protein